MADWREEGEEQDPRPARSPVETPRREASRRSGECKERRWAGTEKVDTGEVKKRLLWLLLAVEIGMALAAACVLPLVFLGAPAGDGGFAEAFLSRVRQVLDSTGGVVCLVLALPVLMLLLSLPLYLWLLRWFRARG
jgi:hypothetical protein